MISRRGLIAAGAGLMGLPQAGRADAGDGVPLWPGAPPGGGGPTGAILTGPHGAVSHISRPSLSMVMPAHPNGSVVLVAAGGGYEQIQIDREAMPAARWLAARGITAAVLTYRLPGEGWAVGPLAPLQDAQRALRLIRAGAAGVPRPGPIGVLGFSAGGHLMGLAATRAAFPSYAGVDAADRLSARPDAAALIYPVITLRPPYAHTGSRRAMVGPHPSPEASAEWSVETHVGSGCPPMFLVQAADDTIADPANIRLMADACRAAGVPVESHLLPSSGHGFAMGKPGTPSRDWPGWYAAWLDQRGFTAEGRR